MSALMAGYFDRASRMRQWATEPPLQASIMRFSSDRMSLSRAIFPSTLLQVMLRNLFGSVARERGTFG